MSVRKLQRKVLLRAGFIGLLLFFGWLALGRPALSMEQAVRWQAAGFLGGGDYEILSVQKSERSESYDVLARCGEEYCDIYFERFALVFWQNKGVQLPLLMMKRRDPDAPLAMRESFWNGTGTLSRALYDMRENAELDGTEECSVNLRFWANDPSIVRVTYTAGGVTKEAVRPEEDRPFWYLTGSFPYRRQDSYRYQGYDATGALVYDSGLCPFR